MRVTAARAAVGVLVACLVLTGCGGDPSPTGSAPRASQSQPSPTSTSADAEPVYVALGDSYTAAPYVPQTDVADGCLRSDHDYPALLAKQTGAKLTDVSCSSATTADLLAPQQTGFGAQVPAQLDALTADTTLVTLGIGGNDGGLFGALAGGCPIVGPNGEQAPDSGRCGVVDEPKAAQALAGLGPALATVLQRIHRDAPRAQVVLVGYPRLVDPDSPGCPSVLPAPASRFAAIDRLTRQLNTTLRDAAQSAGATFVDVFAASVGHDICAGDQAWINGVRTDTARAAPLHPFLAEQQAVADLVEAAIK